MLGKSGAASGYSRLIGGWEETVVSAVEVRSPLIHECFAGTRLTNDAVKTSSARCWSGSFLSSQCCQPGAMALRRADDLHFLPVIGKFSAAFEAGDVRSGEHGRLGAACPSNRTRKTVTGVPAAEKRIDHFGNHSTPSTAGGPEIEFKEVATLPVC